MRYEPKKAALSTKLPRRGRVTGMLATLATFMVAACASEPLPVVSPEAKAHCRDLMYTQRSYCGRCAVDWTIYDRCVRQSAQPRRQ